MANLCPYAQLKGTLSYGSRNTKNWCSPVTALFLYMLAIQNYLVSNISNKQTIKFWGNLKWPMCDGIAAQDNMALSSIFYYLWHPAYYVDWKGV